MSETASTNQTNPQAAPVQPAQFLSNFNDVIPSTPRSAAAAGILGIFLGGFGAHNWYLGQKRRGLLHCILFGGGFLVAIIFGFLATILSLAVPILSILLIGIAVIGYLAMVGNSIWGFVEGIIILSQGDPALAAKGYTVPAPVVYQQPVAQPTAAPAEKPAEKSETKETKEAKETKEDKTTKKADK